ncbi:platelet endothelial cell adhesion molecule-like isoform X2 [Chiloscyllium plagiosum]|uniref:platelet endothelial cell adhesion molecule-like isoform X2 n=1 Tax=Chiloscyllium plagiosum TaxID=36176 RepID=UPI001CB8645C|nr:platelet endothelial cell adhesion molecule-like isoform X2 [Chiloscyllium plagiosum]XP_043539699.1 platelet endothelial cell adhesion molecule-like isoform X2 [Chiloscyllium plagiosum]XP_043539700.1 platelet endothelial cell adhesion molecule-like isoform X2 [Chiloscyllium plagiosum]XP_043539702.1 platelet endothelial cell adhesion molecule-like isoform X2 [Chiloscyllium plagiosum]XP_043539703.1 platelet endothelial cell adhesion molecule-like isoform X2 [Chiloscyllium plagiosum]
MSLISLLLTLLNLALFGITQAIRRPVLYINPATGFLKEGGTLKLECATDKGRVIYWFKNKQYFDSTQSNIYEEPVDSETGGSYHCMTSTPWKKSETVEVVVTVSDEVLTLEANPEHALRNERIEMSCWTRPQNLRGRNHFGWYRNNGLIKQSTYGSLTIESAAYSDEASYRCELKIGYKKWVSNELNITVSDGNVAFHVVPVSPLEGETVKLNCRSRLDIWWETEFTFYKKGKMIHSMKSEKRESSHSIKINSTDDSGLYSCKVYPYISWPVDVQVQERFAKPVLRVGPAAEVFEGLRLMLTCTVQMARPSVQFHYSFHRDSDALKTVPDHSSVYTINATAANDSGNYSCEAIEAVYSLRKRSDNIHISIKQSFAVPKLTVRPEGQLFDGHRIELLCCIEENPFQASLWYTFYRNSVPLQSSSDHSDYISESAHPADSGTYHCEVTNGKVWKRSNQLDLSIRRIPVSKPELIIQPGKGLIEGDTGSLICSVSNGSLPIYYQFYNSSSVELYRELSNSTEVVYNIGAINRRDEGLYHCSVRNEVTGPQHSEDIAITVIVPVKDAVLISCTNGTEIQSGEDLVLRCLVGEGTQPQFLWYHNNVPLRNSSVSYHVTADGGELVIHSFQRDDVGKYHCAAINKGTNDIIFNVTSDDIEFTLRARSYSKEILVSLLSVLLFAGLIVLVCFIHRRRDTGNSSTVSQLRESQPFGEGAAARHLEYAAVGAAHTAGECHCIGVIKDPHTVIVHRNLLEILVEHLSRQIGQFSLDMWRLSGREFSPYTLFYHSL